MSDIIQLLPDSVANQIAAGEVIQRPASVVKELIENSVDAGATTIHLIVVDAGRTSIQVIDDGKGMSDTDARLSFERHATSKIKNATDLFDLHTMGFRGEALASIAAVAQVELKTRLADNELGTHLSIAGSKFVSQEPIACPVGTNFLIENLFYNVPARRKFLKSNNTELNNILTAFQRIALVYPKIHFTLHSNDNEMYNLQSCGLRQRIVDIFGMRLNQFLLPIKVETSVCSVLGFVSKPESARKKGAHQYFFVNGRYMRHPLFHKAVMQAYERLIPAGDQISYFIYLEVNPQDIDVNIHPTKTEIKFENEKAIFQILSATVKDSVGMFNNVATIDFDTEGKPDIPVFDPERQTGMPEVKFDPSYNPFDAPMSSGVTFSSKIGSGAPAAAPLDDISSFPPIEMPNGVAPSPLPGGSAPAPRMVFTADGPRKVKGWEQLYPDAPEEPTESEERPNETTPNHYQFKGRYILTTVKSGLMIIDQHRAHLRILFEQYRQQIAAHKIHPQKLLFPQTIHLDVRENVVMKTIMSELEMAGFELSDLGSGTYAINAIPEGLEGKDAPTLLSDIVSGHEEAGEGGMLENFTDGMALAMARAGAVPYGQPLDNAQMESIINRLFSCSNYNYTPSGKPILTILQQSQIQQMLD